MLDNMKRDNPKQFYKIIRKKHKTCKTIVKSSFDHTPVQSVLKNNKNPLAYKEQNGKGR